MNSRCAREFAAPGLQLLARDAPNPAIPRRRRPDEETAGLPTVRARSWAHLTDLLYEDSWVESLGLFRSRFVFRGEPSSSSGSERRCSGSVASPEASSRISCAISGSSRLPARRSATRSGTGSPSHSITDCRRACSTGRSLPTSRFISRRTSAASRGCVGTRAETRASAAEATESCGASTSAAPRETFPRAFAGSSAGKRRISSPRRC